MINKLNMYNENQLKLIMNVFSQLTFKAGSSESMKEVEAIISIADQNLPEKVEPEVIKE